MSIDFIKNKIQSMGTADAVALGENCISYQDLENKLAYWQRFIIEQQVKPGAVVSIKGDYSADSIALLLCLTENKNIIVPLSNDSSTHFEEFSEIAQIEYEFKEVDTKYELVDTNRHAKDELYEKIRQNGQAGLVLFSSGSTGKSKAIVHNMSALLQKYKHPRHAMRTILFLQFDHIGGINTLLYTLSNGGMAIIPTNRQPINVCKAIEKFKADVLPTSPTFLNLLLISDALERADLSSLKLITYGTEPMPESTLQAVNERFPDIKLQQTYGLSEVGILRSKSRDSGSLWVKVGGEDYQTKIVNGTLWIKSKSAMLGYLNAPSPFDEEGYMNTSDRVEQDGEWLKILGRETDIINVGGEKVYPSELESIILQLENVEDVAVYGMRHPLTGMCVAADIKLLQSEPLPDFKIRLRKFCADKLPKFKIPSKIKLINDYTHNARFKRMRNRT